ncbi:hypothetical protein [Chryseobacterium arthrosphaerae]|nr:hypothetical protein [Chryseobacterium arthrosphaerae]
MKRHPILSSFIILAGIPESSAIGPAISICLYLTGKAKKRQPGID